METIWEFWVIWQAAYLAPAPPFSTHFGGEWANRMRKSFLWSRVRVCVCVAREVGEVASAPSSVRADSSVKMVKCPRVRAGAGPPGGRGGWRYNTAY